MKCTNCGNDVSYNEKICSNCGENNANYVAPYQLPRPSQQQCGQSPPYGVNSTTASTAFPMPPVPNNERLEKFAKTGLIMGVLSAVFFVIVLILTISIMGDAASPYPDMSAVYQKILWVGILFIAAMIVGILGIIFSAISLKPHCKRGWSITGLVLSCVFTAICLIIYLIGL